MFENPALNNKIILKTDTYTCLLHSVLHIIQSFQILNHSLFPLGLSRADRQRECQAADTIKRGLILLMPLKNVCQAQEHTHQFTSQFHKVCKILYFLHILEPVHPRHLGKNKITPWTYFSDTFGSCLTR